MSTTPSTPLAALGERALLQRIQRRLPSVAGVVVGVGDDAAAVEIGPFSLVTTDSLVEGVHFARDTAPPCLLGRKALSINLSDIAAMGGIARYATVSLCLPPATELGWLDSLFDGLLERAAEVGIGLVGGNLSRRAEGMVIDVTMLGDAGPLLLRAGANPGDRVVVTGTLGAAGGGLRALATGAWLDDTGELVAGGVWTESSAEAVRACLLALLDPRPPLAMARAIGERALARAGMDLSDGLSSDLPEICRHSGVGAVIEAGAVPVDPGMASLERARGGDALALALHGGEDYQLLLAVEPAQLEAIVELGRVFGVEVTAIGEFVTGDAVQLRDSSGLQPLEARGHDHFRASGI